MGFTRCRANGKLLIKVDAIYSVEARRDVRFERSLINLLLTQQMGRFLSIRISKQFIQLILCSNKHRQSISYWR